MKDLAAAAAAAAAAAKSLQSCPTLCDPIDGNPLGSSVPWILQARILEWVAISFSNAWKGKVKVKSLSRARLLPTPWTAAYQAPPSMGFSRQEYWSGLPLPSPAAALRATMFPLPSSRFLVLGVHCSQIAPVPISLALGGSLASPLWLETVVLLLGCLRPWAQTASFPGVSPKPLIFVDAASQLFSAGPHCSPRSKAGGCSSHLFSSLPIKSG